MEIRFTEILFRGLALLKPKLNWDGGFFLTKKVSIFLENMKIANFECPHFPVAQLFYKSLKFIDN